MQNIPDTIKNKEIGTHTIKGKPVPISINHILAGPTLLYKPRYNKKDPVTNIIKYQYYNEDEYEEGDHLGYLHD